MWTREQLSEPDSKVAGGVRVDVPQPPAWMRERVEAPLVGAGLVAPGFVDSIALNQYHDGSEGIQVRGGGRERLGGWQPSILPPHCRLAYTGMPAATAACSVGQPASYILHLQSHYDDADRFQQPIFSLRLFSDSRLSFGTQLYG
jgi:hypothetical protein